MTSQSLEQLKVVTFQLLPAAEPITLLRFLVVRMEPSC